jgi:hypothetical protein
MRVITNKFATTGATIALMAGAIAPAAAQTWSGGWNNGWNNGGYNSTWNGDWNGRPMVSGQVGLNTGYGGNYVNRGPLVEAPVAGRVDGGFYGAGTFGAQSCVFDEGYGRVLPCQYGGGAR